MVKSMKLNLVNYLENTFPFLKFGYRQFCVKWERFHEILTRVYHVILSECEQYKIVRIASNLQNTCQYYQMLIFMERSRIWQVLYISNL